MIKRTAFKVTRVGQLVAQEASRRLGVPFGIVDLSLAPTPAIGDSVAEIPEMVDAFVSPGIAIISSPTEQTQVIASNFSNVIAPACTESIIP